MPRAFLAFLFCLWLTSCGPTIIQKQIAAKTQVAGIIQEANSISENMAQNELQSSLERSSFLIRSQTPQMESLGDIFCGLINQKQADNPFKLESFFITRTLDAFTPTLKQLGRISSCQSSKTLFNKYPLQIVQLEVPNIPKLYLLLHLNEDGKIKNLRTHKNKKLAPASPNNKVFFFKKSSALYFKLRN